MCSKCSVNIEGNDVKYIGVSYLSPISAENTLAIVAACMQLEKEAPQRPSPFQSVAATPPSGRSHA